MLKVEIIINEMNNLLCQLVILKLLILAQNAIQIIIKVKNIEPRKAFNNVFHHMLSFF